MIVLNLRLQCITNLQRLAGQRAAALLLAVSIVCGVLLGTHSVAAADNGLKLEIKPGLEGLARHGSWLPVVVSASNEGADFTGTVVLRLFSEGSAEASEWRRDFTVAAGEQSETVFYVPANHNMLQADLLDAGGGVVASAETRVQFRDGVIAGVVASNPDTLRLLAGLDLRPGQQQGGPPQAVTVVRLEPGDLPSFSRALGALDVLAFNDISSQELTAEQWGAIEAWVGQGGVLIFGGGPGWRQTFASVPEALLPVEVAGTKTLNGLSALADFAGEELPAQPVVVSDGRVRDGRIIVQAEGVPLIVESRYGSGHIFYTAFDLGLDPIAFWRGNTQLWRQLLGNAVPYNPYGSRPGGLVDLQWTVRQFPHLDFPSTRNLAFILLGYLAVVGPVNYLVLKRLDRRDWAWVTIPVLVAVVSASIYGISFRGGGRDVLTNSIGILHLPPGVERVPVDTVVGFYAPTRSRLNFEFGPRQHVFPLLQWDRWGWPGGPAQAVNVSATVTQGANTVLSYGEHNNWTVRSFTVLQDIDVPGRIEGELRPTATGDISGTIVNNTPYDLEDVHVLLKNTYAVVGDLPAGAAREVSLQLQQPQSGHYYPGDLIWQIYAPQPPNYETKPEWQQRQNILQNVFSQYDYSSPYDVTIFGWMREPLIDVEFGGPPSQHAQLSLVYGPLEFALPQADFVLPAGLITAELYDSDLAGGWYGNGMLNLESGWAVFSLELPALPPGVELTEVALTANLMGPNANNVMFELFNWQTGHWDGASVVQNKLPVTDLGAYVYEGELRVRVALSQNGYVEVPFPSAIVTGKQVGQ